MSDVTPTNGMKITADTRFAPGVYYLPDGVAIAADGITVDGNGAVLVGKDQAGVGIQIEGRRGVVVRNCKLRDYYHGIVARDARELTIEKNVITGTAEIPANTIFLDIWRNEKDAYGGAIMLDKVTHSVICDNDVQHQMNGVLTYHCRALKVLRNNANYNSGYGFHLYDTSDSAFEENYADYCCRYEPRDVDKPRVGAGGIGHMGADATGFLIVYSSCRNVFRRNFARLGGDGFFLAGRSNKSEDVPCDDNLFEENDGSLSPNIAFEATFSSGNIFRNNWADRCNYGFWLGFSRDNVIEGNRMVHNRQAGIAVENGINFQVRNNSFQRNHVAGILLWSHYVKDWFDALPDQRTPHHWTIAKNTFLGNGAGVAIRADQDHGIRPVAQDDAGRPETRPHDFEIVDNDIQDNRIGVQLVCTDRVVIERNTLRGNVEADIRRDDDQQTTIGSNLGLRGGYL